MPQNYDREFKGWVSARTALGSSLNVPAVRAARWSAPDALFDAAATRSASPLPRDRRLLRHMRSRSAAPT